MKKTITTIILSLLFILSASHVQGQITFDLIVIFKKNAKAIDIEKIKQALKAVQIGSSYPSRALLWRCQVTPGEALELPTIVGGISVFSINNSSEAAGVIASTGQSEGVSNNSFWAIPQTETAEEVASIPSLFGNEFNENSRDAIITCKPGNRQVKIAIMDSGIDCDIVGNSINVAHDGIRPYIALRNDNIDGVDDDLNGFKDDQIGYDFVNNSGFPKDLTGHGTFVTGVVSRIFQHNNAENIKISILKVLDEHNRGYEFDFIRALDYAIRQKVDVVNCSFVSSSVMASNMQPFSIAIEVAKEYGVLVSLAAGNNGKDIDQPDTQYAPSSFKNDNIIVTGATIYNESIAAFSNYGKTNVDIFTPAKRIVSMWLRSSVCSENCYAYNTGTSFAAPQTTAIAALLASNNNKSDWERIKCSILSGATFKDFLVNKCRRAGVLNGVSALTEFNRGSSNGSCDNIVTAAPKNNKINSTFINTYPNPFTNNFYIDMTLPSDVTLQLSVFNLAGEMVSTKSYKAATQGENTLSLTEEETGIKNVGIYFIKIQAGEEIYMKKVVKVERD